MLVSNIKKYRVCSAVHYTLMGNSMNSMQSSTKVDFYSGLLMSLALIAALLFNGANFYLLSLSWVALIICTIYIVSNLKEIEIRFDFIHLAMILFVGWMIISLYWHPAPWRGIEFNWRLGLFFFTTFTVYLLVKEKHARTILLGFFIVAFIDCLLALYQSMHLGEQASGFFINKNNNVAFINLFALPVMARLLLFENRGLRKWGLGTLFVLLSFTILQAVSRGGLLSLAIASSMVFAFAIHERRIKNILFVMTLVSGVFVLDALLSTSELRTDITSQGRWFLYESTLKMIADSPWHGIGNGMFPFFYPGYRHIYEFSAANFVHNDYLQILLELGVPGFSLLILTMVMMTYKFRKLVVVTKDKKSLAPYIGYFSAILVVSIHSMLTFNFYKASILIVLGMYFGLLLRKTKNIKFFELYAAPSVKVGGGVKLLVTIVLLAPLMYVAMTGYADAIASGVIDRDFYDRKPKEKYRIYTELSQFDKDNYKYPARAARALYSSGVNATEANRREIFSRSRALLKYARELDPVSSETYVYEMNLLESYQEIAGKGWRKEAIAIASELLSRNPRWLDVRIKLARFLEGNGQKKDALVVLLKGLQHIHVSNSGYYQYGKRLSEDLGAKYAYERFSYLLKKYQPGYVEELVNP